MDRGEIARSAADALGIGGATRGRVWRCRGGVFEIFAVAGDRRGGGGGEKERRVVTLEKMVRAMGQK